MLLRNFFFLLMISRRICLHSVLGFSFIWDLWFSRAFLFFFPFSSLFFPPFDISYTSLLLFWGCCYMRGTDFQLWAGTWYFYCRHLPPKPPCLWETSSRASWYSPSCHWTRFRFIASTPNLISCVGPYRILRHGWAVLLRRGTQHLGRILGWKYGQPTIY